MGKLSLWDNIKQWFEETFVCRFFGHQFEYEPMEGDLPPYEHDACVVCGEPTLERLRSIDGKRARNKNNV